MHVAPMVLQVIDHFHANGGGRNDMKQARYRWIVASAAIGVKVIDYLKNHGCDVHETTDELLKMFPLCKKEDIEFGPEGTFASIC